MRKPRDQPVVEGSVRFVAHQVAAVLRNRRFVGLAELTEAIFEEVAEINARPFQKREDARLIVFERDERPLLISLPQVRFELADLRKAKAGANYHVQVDTNFTSVPARLIGRSPGVRLTSNTVEVFDGIERVAAHARLKGAARPLLDHGGAHARGAPIQPCRLDDAGGSGSGPRPSARTPPPPSKRSWHLARLSSSRIGRA